MVKQSLAALLLLAPPASAAAARAWIKPSAPASVAQVQAVVALHLKALSSLPPAAAAARLAAPSLPASRADQQAQAALKTLIALPDMLERPAVLDAASATIGDDNLAIAAFEARRLRGAAATDAATAAALKRAGAQALHRAIGMSEALASDKDAAMPAVEPGRVWTQRETWTGGERTKVTASALSDEDLVTEALRIEKVYRSERRRLLKLDYWKDSAREARSPGDLYPEYDAIMDELSRRPAAILDYEDEKDTLDDRVPAVN